ncbi:MAG: 2-dehydropantoate 2-reductase [Desulfurococcales archaeon]|nr:2-dehydropantoate 2-reductase [Desulfurococcales archaeon]
MNPPCIIGCGAMGGLLALQLYKATATPPICITRRGEQAGYLQANGLTVSLPQGRVFHVPVRAYPAEEVAGTLCRRAVVSVKAYDLPKALDVAKETGVDDAWVLVNGLVGEDLMRDLGFKPRFIVSTYGATRVSDTEVEVRGSGVHLIGSPEGLDGESCRLSLTLSRGGADAYCVGNITPWRIEKAAVNAAINGITSILDSENGIITSNPYARSLAERVGSEAERIIQALKLGNVARSIVEEILRVAEETAGNVSSMLQDLRSCRGTEADSIYKPLIELARQSGLKAGTIETLYITVKAIEWGGHRCRRSARR